MAFQNILLDKDLAKSLMGQESSKIFFSLKIFKNLFLHKDLPKSSTG